MGCGGHVHGLWTMEVGLEARYVVRRRLVEGDRPFCELETDR